MEGKIDDHSESTENEMEGASGPESNTEFPLYPHNNLNLPSATPTYDQATQAQHQHR